VRGASDALPVAAFDGEPASGGADDRGQSLPLRTGGDVFAGGGQESNWGASRGAAAADDAGGLAAEFDAKSRGDD